MSVYGGDVGLDEFAKHPNAKLLWETAQGRVAWGHDLAVWSSHDGEDTLFHQFAQQARAQCGAGAGSPLTFGMGEGSGARASDSSSSSSSTLSPSSPQLPQVPHPGYCAKCHNLL